MSATVHLLPILAVIFLNAVGAGAASGETGVAAADTTSQTLTFEQDVRPLYGVAPVQTLRLEAVKSVDSIQLGKPLLRVGMLAPCAVEW